MKYNVVLQFKQRLNACRFCVSISSWDVLWSRTSISTDTSVNRLFVKLSAVGVMWVDATFHLVKVHACQISEPIRNRFRHQLTVPALAPLVLECVDAVLRSCAPHICVSVHVCCYPKTCQPALPETAPPPCWGGN